VDWTHLASELPYKHVITGQTKGARR